MSHVLIFMLLLTTSKTSKSQEGAQYLSNVVRDLKNLRGKHSLQRVEPSPHEVMSKTSTSQPYVNRRIQHNEVPELTFTKGELASIYEAAVAKGHTVKLNTVDEKLVNAAIYETGNHPTHLSNHIEADTHHDPGYYYYYYPIKSFIDELSSQPEEVEHGSSAAHSDKIRINSKPHYQYHTHTHQHNVRIAPMKPIMEGEKVNKLEPLFMAISGFVGMAVMFVLSLIVLPKFGTKSKPSGKNNEIDDIARIALQAIDGQDCSERFACELGKTARSFQFRDNRFVKLFRRMAPTIISKKFARVEKYSNKQLKCTEIPCKKKPLSKPGNKNPKKTRKPMIV